MHRSGVTLTIGLFGSVAIVSIGLYGCATAAYAQSGRTAYDVVPPSWITNHVNLDRKRAYVFPSLRRMQTASALSFRIADFFSTSNRFGSKEPFQWRDWSGQLIRMRVSRSGAGSDAAIYVTSASETAIRRLDWRQFRRLQHAFKDWLCRRSGIWLFGDCRSKFTNLQEDLNAIWAHQILAAATFKMFANSYLNDNGPAEVFYTPPGAPLQTTAGEPFTQDETRMFVTRIRPGQELVVTWGNDDFYPAPSALLNGYSRFTSGAKTELRTVNDHGIRLFPAYSCEMRAEFQATTASDGPGNGLLPFPPTWAGLYSTEFMPIYNLFDLHNTALLHRGTNVETCAKRDQPPPRAPRYLFLLSPAGYLKPDTGPSVGHVARFEHESRPAFTPAPTNASDKDDIEMLPRHFLLVGCDSSDTAKVEREWSYMLAEAFDALPNVTPVDPGKPACGGFVSGLFAGKSFVELRDHFSINGSPNEFQIPDTSTIGQALAGPLALYMNRASLPKARPILELLRTPEGDMGKRPLAIRFYTTMRQVLDQAYILEGDQFHAASIPEGLQQ